MSAPALEDGPVTVLVVHVDELRCALTLDEVVEVLPAIATSALPGSPATIDGVIDLRGTLVPILDLRARLGLPRRRPHRDDHIVVCDLGPRRVGVWVDRADDVILIDRHNLAPATEVAAADFLPGVARLDGGLMLVYDVRAFLAADEALCLDAALAVAGQGPR